MKVLLIAEQANPDWVSVPLVGWSLTDAIRKQVDAILVTHVRNRPSILARGLKEHEDVVFIDNEHIAAPLHRLGQVLRGGAGKGWTAVTALETLSYYSFEAQVWHRFRSLIVNGTLSLVHRVTPLSPTAPSLLAKRCAQAGVPFILGPLNGGLPWPTGFEDRRHAEREWLSYVRSLYKLLPGYRATRKYATKIIVASQVTLAQMPRSVYGKCIVIPENGVSSSDITPSRHLPDAFPLKILFVGRLVPYKCPDLLLEACRPLVDSGMVSLTVVGSGPLENVLKHAARRVRHSDRVVFKGWLPRKEVLSLMREHHVLALPSIREFGGGVVVEAMAQGLPPVVADYGGPAELVGNDDGVKVPFEDAASLTTNFRRAITDLVGKTDVLRRLSAARLAKARTHFDWDAKARQIVRLYQQCIG